MPISARIEIRRADWVADAAALRAIRRTVFIDEQKVPEHLEWDAFDPVSLHVLAVTPEGDPVGTGRLLPDGHLGRMAVLKSWRGRGVGLLLLRHLIAEARARGDSEILLHAQTHALGFYSRCGFSPVGGEFIEADIPHRLMTLKL